MKNVGALYIEAGLIFGMFLVLLQSRHVQDLFLWPVHLRIHIHAHICSLKVGEVRFFFFSQQICFPAIGGNMPSFQILPCTPPPQKTLFLKWKLFFKDSPAICCQLASESLLSRTIVIFLRLFGVPQKLDLDFFHFWPSGRREMSFHGEEGLKQKDSATDWWICVSPFRTLNMKCTSLHDSKRLPRAPSD